MSKRGQTKAQQVLKEAQAQLDRANESVNDAVNELRKAEAVAAMALSTRIAMEKILAPTSRKANNGISAATVRRTKGIVTSDNRRGIYSRDQPAGAGPDACDSGKTNGGMEKGADRSGT